MISTAANMVSLVCGMTGMGDTAPDINRILDSKKVTDHHAIIPTVQIAGAKMETAGASETDKDAERKGLGTPATRADIIDKLVHDGYVKRKGKTLTATEEGMYLVSIVPDRLKSPVYTAEWENNG